MSDGPDDVSTKAAMPERERSQLTEQAELSRPNPSLADGLTERGGATGRSRWLELVASTAKMVSRDTVL